VIKKPAGADLFTDQQRDVRRGINAGEQGCPAEIEIAQLVAGPAVVQRGGRELRFDPCSDRRQLRGGFRFRHRLGGEFGLVGSLKRLNLFGSAHCGASPSLIGLLIEIGASRGISNENSPSR
jgi:hypothetical protein